jgi:hypothetical protein
MEAGLAFAEEQIEAANSRADALQVVVDVEREIRIKTEEALRRAEEERLAFWSLGVVARTIAALKGRRPG